MKKLKKFIKFILVGIIWSYIYVYITNILMILIWNFNYLSPRDWSVVSSFWEGGGRIKSGKDYLFITMLIAVLPLWIAGWRYFYKKNFVQMLIAPVIWYNKRQLKKYSNDSSRVVLKNMGGNAKGPDMKQVIENRMKLFEKNKNSDPVSLTIREGMQEKITTAKEKK